VRRLGQGGFGQVYLAVDSQLERYCVVKRLVVDSRWSDTDQQLVRQNFQREARLLATLNVPGHPNIPEIYEYLAESYCLVMKYIEGRDLGALLWAAGGRLPEADALRYVRDACSALAYMHSRTPEPVLHRDVKPANILLDAARRIWLVDFGIAKAAPAGFSAGDVHNTQYAGTLGYAPAEQWQGAAEPRSDIYAVGVTLHTLLTGYHPALVESTTTLQEGLIVLPPVRQLNPDLHPEVERLIQWATAFEASDRPSALEFLGELDTILNRLATPPPPEPARPPESVDFVGRSEELAALGERLRRRGLVVIGGLAGVGKTTLAAELVCRTAPADIVFWHSFRHDEGVDTLLWALAGFLAFYGQSEPWRLIYGARNSGGQPPPNEMLFDYLLQTLRRRQCLLCLDDLQLIGGDPPIARLVERLLREVQAGALRLIVTTRSIPTFVPPGDYVALGGLNDEDACRLLARVGLALSGEVLHELLRSTGGNVQLLRLSADVLRHAAIPAQVVGRLAESDDIERYLLREVDASLSDEERTVMAAVAVLRDYGGGRDAVETLLGHGGARRALNDLAGRHLLTVSESEAGHHYSQHGVLQEFYYRSLGRSERRMLHARAGVFYEREEPDLLRAAWHFAWAGDEPRAARLATAGVWALINRGQAGGLRRLLEQLDPRRLESPLQVDVAIAQGEVYALLGESELARNSYTAAFALLSSLPPSPQLRERKARVCRGMGEALELESPQQALAWLRKGLEEVAGQGWLEEAILLLKVGSVMIATGEYATAQTMLNESLRQLPEHLSDWRARALMSLGVIFCFQGQIDQGKACYLQALALYRQTDNYWGMVAVRQNLGIELDIAGHWSGATEEYRQGLELARRLGSISLQAVLELSLGICYTKQGADETARTHLLHCLDLARRHGLKEYLVNGGSSLADLLLRLGEWDAAEAALAEAAALARELNLKGQQAEIDRGWALLLLARGRLRPALAAAERSVALARDLGLEPEEGMSLRLLGQVLVALGRYEEGLAAFAGSLALLADSDPYEAARTKTQWGRALLARADEHGRALLEAGRATFEELGAARDLALVEAMLGSESDH
jgi:ATP/maltotriose-dependent transcriptional regulator MalT/tRNA A-37 threonylcarbamoyl transferase component Bud32